MKDEYPIYKKIATELRERISVMPGGTKLPSEAALCAEFAISRMTANKIINMLVTEKAVYRIKGSGTYAGGKLAEAKPIYFLLPCPDFFMYDCTYNLQVLLSCLAREAAKNGIVIKPLAVSKVNNPGNIDHEVLENINDGDRVVVSGFWFEKTFPNLLKKKCAVAFCDFHSQEQTKYPKTFKNWTILKINARETMCSAVTHLKKLGRNRIAYVFENYPQDDPLNSGYRDGLEACKLTFRDEYYIYSGNQDIMFDRLSAKNSTFDALIISNPAIARQSLRLLAESGRKVPADIAVLVFNDHKKFFDYTPPLAAVSMPIAKIGSEIINSFVNTDGGRKILTFSGEIIERESICEGSGTGRENEALIDLNRNFSF